MGEEEDYGTLIYRDSQLRTADAAVAAIKNSYLLRCCSVKAAAIDRERQTRQLLRR
jgi:hypothetical protein